MTMRMAAPKASRAAAGPGTALRRRSSQDPRFVSAWARRGSGGVAALLADGDIPLSARREIATEVAAVAGNHQVQRLLQPMSTASKQVLRMGSQGPEVRELQQGLAANGADITADGGFGPKTRQAVVGFQASAGLVADGVVGPKTWTVLGGGTVPTTGTGAGGGVDTKVAKAVEAKLREVQLVIQQIASAGKGTTGPASTGDHPLTLYAPMTQHDGEDGEEKSWWDEATEAVGGAVDTVAGAVGDAAEAVGGVVDEAWNGVTETAGEIVEAAEEAAGEAWNEIKASAGEVAGAVGEVAGAVGEAVTGGIEVVGEAVGEVAQGVVDVATSVGDTVQQVVDALGEQYAGEIAAVKEFIAGVGYYLANPGKALEKLEEILGGLKKKAKELLGIEDEEPTPGAEVYEGTAPDVEVKSSSTQCRDVKISTGDPNPPGPGMRRLSVVSDLGGVAEPQTGLPRGGTQNHDAVRPTLEFVGVPSQNDAEVAKVPKGDFATTGAIVKIKDTSWRAERFTDYVTIKSTLLHRVGWSLTDEPGRLNVDADLSNITEENWDEAADDLDPDVHKTALGAPKRADFWCMDLTVAHEEFHVHDSNNFMKDVATPAVRTYMSVQTIDVPRLFFRESEVNEQVHKIAVRASETAKDLRNTHMKAPAVEVRTYAADAPAYRARAKAIREKAKREGWKRIPWTRSRR